MYLQCHREDSRFIRLANSAVSLSTSEALLRLTATAMATIERLLPASCAGWTCRHEALPGPSD